MSASFLKSRLPITLSIILAISIGVALFIPIVRQTIQRTLGMQTMPKETLAFAQCTLNQTSDADSDPIYFLSCGGIY